MSAWASSSSTKFAVAGTIGFATFASLGLVDVVRHATGKVPLVDPTTLQGGAVVHRSPCRVLQGYDVVVRHFFAPRRRNPEFSDLPWWRQKLVWFRAIFRDDTHESYNEGRFNATTALADDPANRVTSTRVITDALPATSSVTIAQPTAGGLSTLRQVMDKYATMSLEPSEGERASLRGMLDGLTHQSMVKCSSSRAAADRPDTCLSDPRELETPYLRVMLAALAFFPFPLPSSMNMCAVGVAGGALPMFVQNYFTRSLGRLDLVDVEPAVFDVARTQMGLRQLINAPVEMHAADGEEYLLKTKHKYDIIFLDTFVGSRVPEHLTAVPFIKVVHASLTPGGVAVFNLPAHDAKLVETIESIFRGGAVYEARVPKSSNVVVFAAMRIPDKTAKRHIVNRARRLSAEYGLPFDLSVHLPLKWSLW